MADGVALDFEVRTGDGERVLLVHAGCLSARRFEALVREPALGERHQLVTYHRTAAPPAAGLRAQ